MNFVKMHGIGNDFVVVDARGLASGDWPGLAKAVCHRRFGVGADGLILAVRSSLADLGMRVFNPDGSEAEMCGNGIRCFARYAFDRGLAVGSELSVDTLAGIMRVGRKSDKDFAVSMGVPNLAAREIPVDVDLPRVLDYPLSVAGRHIPVTCVSMGNPHAVFFTSENPDLFPLEDLGPIVERHPFFPKRVNFEVCQAVTPDLLLARVWERGAGITLACGTGACAVAVAARLKGLSNERSVVRLPGGSLEIAWSGVGEVLMTGPADYVFEGRWGQG